MESQLDGEMMLLHLLVSDAMRRLFNCPRGAYPLAKRNPGTLERTGLDGVGEARGEASWEREHNA